ncbi:uncharacterized protein PFL1_06348 [Pseudozyma flocculosa PF-1]|uniref:Uncharacterized protein n=2 Tax=Pseudozyma flocculosa TaxID=84751 RepID=A0A5C3F9H3_9BASI|nr:uncharacterized protein PFL1_06348 [Pseudozyma flocculosa PF-1]EPQ26140.1 hypothetical protein PFL1_06348 [Pseudozyma flocculosa PF-1]SPO40387.1 uncharacterized protein PSFLO_05869 [Pseudozyma flocculosa]
MPGRIKLSRWMSLALTALLITPAILDYQVLATTHGAESPRQHHEVAVKRDGVGSGLSFEERDTSSNSKTTSYSWTKQELKTVAEETFEAGDGQIEIRMPDAYDQSGSALQLSQGGREGLRVSPSTGGSSGSRTLMTDLCMGGPCEQSQVMRRKRSSRQVTGGDEDKHGGGASLKRRDASTGNNVHWMWTAQALEAFAKTTFGRDGRQVKVDMPKRPDPRVSGGSSGSSEVPAAQQPSGASTVPGGKGSGTGTEGKAEPLGQIRASGQGSVHNVGRPMGMMCFPGLGGCNNDIPYRVKRSLRQVALGGRGSKWIRRSVGAIVGRAASRPSGQQDHAQDEGKKVSSKSTSSDINARSTGEERDDGKGSERTRVGADSIWKRDVAVVADK